MGGLAAAGGFGGAAAALGGVGVPGVPEGGLPAADEGDMGAAAASARAGGVAPLAPGVGFCASPPLAALGGAFCSSAISVDAYGKAPLYGQQNLEFLHIADKHVNREARTRFLVLSPPMARLPRVVIVDVAHHVTQREMAGKSFWKTSETWCLSRPLNVRTSSALTSMPWLTGT